MKNSWIYFIVLLLLGFITYWFVFRETEPSFPEGETNFSVKDSNSIQKIFLSNLRNENVKITRVNNTWKLNDSLDIRLDAVSGLLDVLYRQYPEKPVPTGYHDAAIKELSTTATKIEIYTNKGKTHSFYVSQIPAPGNATYMMNEGAKRPYIVKLPMENNYVGIRYFTGEANWRSKHILFSVNPIQRIQVNYSDSTQHNFNIFAQSNTDYMVEGNSKKDSALNKKRVNTYIQIYEKVFCTGFEPKFIYKDSIINKGKQMATITVQRKGETQQSLTLFFKPASQDTKTFITVDGKNYDGNYFFALLNQKDFMVMNRNTVHAMLRRCTEFYEKD